MKEKIKEISKSSSEIEEEISERIYEKIKEEKVSDSELDEVIFKEIENNMLFSEDWQKHYAKERIKEGMKEKKFNFLPASTTRRFLNLLLDLIFFYIFYLILILIFKSGVTGLYYYIILVLYYLIFESIWSKTPAKFITKTKVITEYGEKPNFKTIFIRTLLRFVPFEVFSFLSPEHPRGWHDRWSGTIVIDDISISKKISQEKTKESLINYCQKCGAKIQEDSKFCTNCGNKLT